MNTWTAKDVLFTSMCGDVTLDVHLAACPTQHGYLLQGLRTGFYPGGSSVVQQLYASLVEAACVHGLWIRRSRRHGNWEIYPVGNRPTEFNQQLHERYIADCLAWNLEHPPAQKVYDGYTPTNTWFPGHTRVMQDKHWLRDLSARYVDDAYRRRVEPYIKRVENGRLVIRRTNGKWSIG